MNSVFPRLAALTGMAAALLTLAMPPAAGVRAQRKRPPPQAARNTDPVTPKAGRIEGSVYTNDYFGMRMKVPEGWNVADQAGVEQIYEKGAEMIAGGSQARQERLEQASKSIVSLITIGKLIPGEKGDTMAMLMVIAEPIPSWLIKTGKDYNGVVKRMMLDSSAKYEIVDVGAEKVGGLEFAIMTAVADQPTGRVRQKFYSAIHKGHALALIWTYITDEGERELAGVVKTVEFK